MMLSYQPEMFPDTDPRLSKHLPAADIVPLLERAARCYEGGRSELARIIAERVGGRAQNYDRILNRLASGQQDYLTARMADLLALGIGLHPSNVWAKWGSAA